MDGPRILVTVVVAVALMVAVEDACPARNDNDNSQAGVYKG
jgi:hypothetical protein